MADREVENPHLNPPAYAGAGSLPVGEDFFVSQIEPGSDLFIFGSVVDERCDGHIVKG